MREEEEAERKGCGSWALVSFFLFCNASSPLVPVDRPVSRLCGRLIDCRAQSSRPHRQSTVDRAHKVRTIVYIVYGEVATRPHLGGGPLVMKYDTACKVIQHGTVWGFAELNLHGSWAKFGLGVSVSFLGPFVWGWDDDVPLSACALLFLPSRISEFLHLLVCDCSKLPLPFTP